MSVPILGEQNQFHSIPFVLPLGLKIEFMIFFSYLGTDYSAVLELVLEQSFYVLQTAPNRKNTSGKAICLNA